jgi:hypothetical protein
MSSPYDFATRTRLVKALLADESPLRRAQSDFAAGQLESRAHLIRALLQGEDGSRSGYATRQLEPNRAALIRALLQHDGGRHSGYDPNQPRIPAGNPDGGQWTSAGGTAATGGASAAEINGDGADGAPWTSGSDKPWSRDDSAPTDVSAAKKRRPRRWLEPPRDDEPYKEVWQAIQAFRVKHTQDFFQKMTEEGVVACTEINGREVCGSNSGFKDAYDAEDYKRATDLRQDLISKHLYIMAIRNIGFKPNVAVYHAETTVLLRAKHENGGTLAGQTMRVFVEKTPCPSCQAILPYIGLELGNPTVTFISRSGWTRTMRNGRWID